MGKINWTEKASSHLQGIHDYIAKDSKIYATRFISSLIKATLKLETMPLCGRIVPEFEDYGLREVIYGKFYRDKGRGMGKRAAVRTDEGEVLCALQKEAVKSGAPYLLNCFFHFILPARSSRPRHLRPV